MELNPLAQIDPVVVVTTIVVFIATYFLMRRVYFDRTVAVMEARETRCEAAAEACQHAQKLLEDARAHAAELEKRGREEADVVIARARETAEEEKSRLVSDAREQGEARLREGREKLLAERDREIASLKTEARECIGLACEKLAGAADPAVVDDIVDRLVAKTLQ